MTRRNKYKLAVTNNVLLFTAGVVWICVGTVLLFLAFSWLSNASKVNSYVFVGAGVLLALIAHHFGFLKIVDKNLERILSTDEKKCFFSFIPLKSYLIIVVMIVMGTMLRHSAIPKQYLAILYIGIGLALLLSSVRYIRVSFWRN
ncbi:MAG: hypothetical protein Q8O92_02260 [Candidatus Latescibacter sp.]|nr:hypothetical protein [Candidatus Latescibacter sp.]